ncbi:MAG: hypothetical protein LCH79_16005 [Proteobacteria bacterium]|nr:hypothetical protein [Pseudomonadota bacterium]
MSLSLSDARDFFASKAYSNYRSSLDSRQKLVVAVLERLNTVIKAIGTLAKVMIAVARR